MKMAVEQQKCLHYMNLVLKVWYNIWNVYKSINTARIELSHSQKRPL